MYIGLHADVQLFPSDWEEAHALRDVWKCTTTERGEQSATIRSAMLTLALSATVLELVHLGQFQCISKEAWG